MAFLSLAHDVGYAAQDRVHDETEEGGMLSFSSPFEEKGGEEEGDEELSRAEEGGSPRPRMSRMASSRAAVAVVAPKQQVGKSTGTSQRAHSFHCY